MRGWGVPLRAAGLAAPRMSPVSVIRGMLLRANRVRLPANAHVFAHAGKASADEVEAFRVVWGAILKPDGDPLLLAGNGVLVY